MKKLCMLALIVTALYLFAGCGSGNASDTVSDTDIDAVYSEITKSVELPEMVTLDEDRQFDYMGLDPELISSSIVAISGDSIRADEIWLINAADSSSAEKIASLASSRVEQRANEYKNYNAEVYAVIQEAKVLRRGNCVALFISPDAETMENIFMSRS